MGDKWDANWGRSDGVRIMEERNKANQPTGKKDTSKLETGARPVSIG